MQKTYWYRLFKRFGFFPSASFDDEAETINFGGGSVKNLSPDLTVTAVDTPNVDSNLIATIINGMQDGDMVELTALLKIENYSGDSTSLTMNFYCNSFHISLGAAQPIDDETTMRALCRLVFVRAGNALVVRNKARTNAAHELSAFTPESFSENSFGAFYAGTVFNGVNFNAGLGIAITATLTGSAGATLSCESAIALQISAQ